MTLRIEDQLRAYFAEVDREQEAVDLELFGEAPMSGFEDGILVLPQDENARTPTDPRGIVLLSAAAIVVLLVGLYVVLRSGTDNSAPVFIEQPELTTTVPDTVASTEPPSSSTTLSDEATLTDSERLPRTVSGETQRTIVGDITWTRLEGDETTQPEHVEFEFEGEFFGSSEAEGLVWRSSDGIDWTRGETLVDGWFRPFELDGETWGIVHSGTGQSELVRWNGTSFDPIELPDSTAPEIVGLDSQGANFGELTEFRDLAISPANTWYTVKWTDFYTASEPPPPPNGPPDGEPMLYAEWDVVSATIRLHDPFTNSQTPVAVLTPELTSGPDGRLDLRDAGTGEIVTSVLAMPELFDDTLLNAVVGGGFSHSELLIGTDGEFRLEPAPWQNSNPVGLAVLGSELLAIVLTDNSTPGEWRPDWALWTSSDAQSWSQVQLPEASGMIDHIEMVATDDDSLLLTMIVSSNFDQGAETWTTTDAVTWSPIDLGFDGFAGPTAADFGWYRDPFHDMDGLWVSPDAVTWQMIDIDIREPRGAGSAGAMVIGNTIFLTTNENAGPRTMWVGVVDSG